jgi:hypothetical protein
LFIHIPLFISSYVIPISFAFLVFTYAHASTGSQEETPIAEPGEQDVPAQEVHEDEQPGEEL